MMSAFIATWASDGNLLFLLYEMAFALAYFGCQANRLGLPYTENPVLLFGGLSYGIVLMYFLMFDLITPLPFLLKASLTERYNAVFTSAIFINALIFGGFFSLSIFAKSKKIDKLRVLSLSQSLINQLFALAWIPILFATVAYFAYFRTQPYVALHIDGGGAWGHALKFVYISYAVVCIVGLLEDDFSKYRNKLILLTIGFVIVYGYLFKLRSPLMYYLLMLLFLFGRRAKLKTIILAGCIVIISLSAIALLRDASLTQSGVGSGLLNMVVGLGAQADTLIFTQHYIDMHGPLYGSGMIGSFLGLIEPMTNAYTRSISQDYFDDGGGFGFFIISDFLLNFGLWTGATGMAIFGLLLTNIRRNKSGFFSLVLVATIYANAFSLVRNDFGSTFRACLYTLVTVVCILMLLRFAKYITTRELRVIDKG